MDGWFCKLIWVELVDMDAVPLNLVGLLGLILVGGSLVAYWLTAMSVLVAVISLMMEIRLSL